MTDSAISNQVPGVQRGHAQQQQVGEHPHVLDPDITHITGVETFMFQRENKPLMFEAQFLTRRRRRRKLQTGAASST